MDQFSGGGSLGYGGNDVIYGNQDLDTLSGGDGNDVLYGGQNTGTPLPADDGISRQISGTEFLYGGNGDDLLYGNYGSELMFGEAGSDTLYGGQGDDSLSGGVGSDVLLGNRGNDVLHGGTGADLFVIASGSDTIQDFSLTEGDRIQVGDRLSITDGASGALVTFTNGSSVTLVGISAASVGDGIFV